MAAVAEPQLASASEAMLGKRRSDAEFHLLLACCSQRPVEQRRKQIEEILCLPLDWPRVLRIAEHHRVLSQLYTELTAIIPNAPEPRNLAALYNDNVRKTFVLTCELIKVLRQLRASGVHTLAHKGPTLAVLLYGETSARQFRDLDILVRPQDVARAKSALSEIGYAATIQLNERQERAYISSGYEYGFRSADGRILLELQWRILPRFYSVDLEVNGFFEHPAEIDIGGSRVPTLCNEDIALSVCLHAAKHLWTELCILCDVTQLANLEIDWKSATTKARTLGMERILGLSFCLAHKLLAAQIPHDVRTIIERDDEIENLAPEIENLIAESRDYNSESVAYFRWMMRLREIRKDRGQFLWRLLSTPGISEWTAIKLPRMAFPAYRLVRCARLVKRFAF